VSEPKSKKYTIHGSDGSQKEFHEKDLRPQHLNLRSDREETSISHDNTYGDVIVDHRSVSGDFLFTEHDEQRIQRINATGYTVTHYGDTAGSIPIRKEEYERRSCRDINGVERFEFVKTSDSPVYPERGDGRGLGCVIALLGPLICLVVPAAMNFGKTELEKKHSIEPGIFYVLSSILVIVIGITIEVSGGWKTKK
jgi:hypothetical protein